MFFKSQVTLARLATLAVLAATTTIAAHAEWTKWVEVPNTAGVEVSFRQVTGDVCTWRFRNAGSSTLRTFDFKYSFVPEAPNASHEAKVTRFDALDQPLKRGQSAGDSLVYTAETHSCPANISVQRIQWDK